MGQRAGEAGIAGSIPQPTWNGERGASGCVDLGSCTVVNMSASRRWASHSAVLTSPDTSEARAASDVEEARRPVEGGLRSSQSQRGEEAKSREVIEERVDVDEGDETGRIWIGFKTVRPAMLHVVSSREVSVYGENGEKMRSDWARQIRHDSTFQARCAVNSWSLAGTFA